MGRTVRNAVGVLADVGIGAFGLVLLARGLVIVGLVLAVVAVTDLAGRLRVLPFARRAALTTRQRADLMWGVALTLVGAAILGEELVAVADGRHGARHLAALALGAMSLVGALTLFVRLVRSRR